MHSHLFRIIGALVLSRMVRARGLCGVLAPSGNNLPGPIDVCVQPRDHNVSSVYGEMRPSTPHSCGYWNWN